MTYLVVSLALFIQALGGFGGGLIAVPLLTILHEPGFIVPPFSLLVVTMNLFILFEVRENIAWKMVSMIAAGSLFGLPLGVAALKYLDQDLIRLIIAVVTLLLGTVFLCGFKPAVRQTPAVFSGAGLVSGFLGGAAAMGGPPLIFLAMVLGLRKENFRATLVACFTINGIVSNTLYFAGGLFSPSNLAVYAAGLLPALAGALLGIKVKNRLPEALFSRLTMYLVIAVGLLGTFRAVALLLNTGLSSTI